MPIPSHLENQALHSHPSHISTFPIIPPEHLREYERHHHQDHHHQDYQNHDDHQQDHNHNHANVNQAHFQTPFIHSHELTNPVTPLLTQGSSHMMNPLLPPPHLPIIIDEPIKPMLPSVQLKDQFSEEVSIPVFELIGEPSVTPIKNM